MTYVGPSAAVQSYCTQEISPELNVAVTSLLAAVKAQQDKAMAKNPGKVCAACLEVREGGRMLCSDAWSVFA